VPPTCPVVGWNFGPLAWIAAEISEPSGKCHFDDAAHLKLCQLQAVNLSARPPGTSIGGRISSFRDQEPPIATAPSKPLPAEVAGLSFEAALRELETIVARLEQGEVDLEDSIALYERGQALKAHCEAKLKAAEGRLEKIVLGASGPEGAVPADAA